jgi:hypothetical protein
MFSCLSPLQAIWTIPAFTESEPITDAINE